MLAGRMRVFPAVLSIYVGPLNIAGIAQLGEQQTEVLEVPCSIHGPGILFLSFLSVRCPISVITKDKGSQDPPGPTVTRYT
ncbi:hypothetical protein M405DRAFT_366963 [Rhizopogon salebrosus TDB-379]|nr:hypothetical protein M405DRAFT_366963 [Rhizopogon salebrosus TDB-379]